MFLEDVAWGLALDVGDEAASTASSAEAAWERVAGGSGAGILVDGNTVLDTVPNADAASDLDIVGGSSESRSENSSRCVSV